MNFDTKRLRGFVRDIFCPEQDAAAGLGLGRWTRQGLAIVLSALMIMIPMGLSDAFAQEPPPPDEQTAPPPDGQSVPRPPQAGQPNPPVADGGQQVPQGQALSPEQLDQLIAPIALYPDALVAQILAASTYPTQVVEADRWRQAQGNAAPEQIAAGAESQSWDPSVKALTAFPSVLSQMDQNIQWTTDLGNAYYNQPQDVMDSVQAMRQKAQAAGQLRSGPQEVVTNTGGAIAIAPANPTVVYVPVYNPWVVYGSPFPVYPGYYYAPPPGIFWGGLAIGFGVGIGIGLFARWGWGWGHWGIGWRSHAVFYNHATFITHSTTVINRGLGRPGGPARGFGPRGAYARASFNRGSVNRSASYRGAARPGGSAGRPGGAVPRPNGPVNRSAAVSRASRPAAGGGRSAPAGHASQGRPSGGHGGSAGGHDGHGR